MSLNDSSNWDQIKRENPVTVLFVRNLFGIVLHMTSLEIATHSEMDPGISRRTDLRGKQPPTRGALCGAVLLGILAFADHENAAAADGPPTPELIGFNLRSVEIATAMQIGFAVVHRPKQPEDRSVAVLTGLIPPHGMTADAAIAILGRAMPQAVVARSPSGPTGK